MLSKTQKSAYGAAEMGITAIEFFIQVYLLKFYADMVGLSPGTAGLVLALAVIWDAVTDPVMGRISDQTKLASGRRRPYVMLGAVLLALSFVWLFNPPELEGETAKAVFLLAAYLIVNTAMTVIAVPHTALAAEISDDLDERTEVFGWRFLFANLGLMAGILLPGIFASIVGENSVAAAAGVASTAVAGLLLLSAAVTFRGTRGLDRPAPEHREDGVSFFKAMGAVLVNPVFLPLLAAFVIGSMGRTVNSAIALFYYEYRLELDEASVFLYILLPFTLLIALSILLWLKVSKTMGKKKPAFWGILLLGIYTFIAYPLFPAGLIWPPLIGGMIGGVLAGAVFLLDSTVADVVDLDELESGEHREGLYFGVWRMGTKLARALGLAVSGFLLDWIGFVGAAEQQDPKVAEGLAWLFGPGVGSFFILAALVLLLMPLDRQRSIEVRAALDARKQGQA